MTSELRQFRVSVEKRIVSRNKIHQNWNTHIIFEQFCIFLSKIIKIRSCILELEGHTVQYIHTNKLACGIKMLYKVNAEHVGP